MLRGIRASDDVGDSLGAGIEAASGADHITIPDAHLLFSGEYKRSGSFDLKIVGEDGKSVLIPDYFKSDKRATLQSAEGATLAPDIVEALAGSITPGQYAQASQPSSDAAVIGRVSTVSGNATILRNGVTVTLNAGDAIQKGDVLQTGSGSKLGVAFIDGSTLILDAGSRLVVSNLVYEAGGSDNSALLNLVQGATNFLAGQIAKTGDLKVTTPAVNMGIRGTAVILDISANDGRVSVSVIDQRDNQIHRVEIFDGSGVQIATAVSNGGLWTLTPTASLQVLAQETSKTPLQIQTELAVLQELLAAYGSAQQYFPVPLPQHTEIDPKTLGAVGTKFLTSFPPLPGPDEPHTFVFGTVTGLGTEGTSGTSFNTSDTDTTSADLDSAGVTSGIFAQIVNLDEDGDAPFPITPLTGSVPGGVGDNPDAPIVYFGGPGPFPVAAAFTGPQPLFEIGPNGLAAIDPIVFDTAALDALGLTSGGEPVTFTFDAVNLFLTGETPSGDIVIRLAIVDPLTGDFGVAFLRPLDHPAGADENEIDIPITFTLTDGNGTQTTSGLIVRVDDDSIDLCNPVPGFIEEAPGWPISVSGTLDLEWGADNFNTNSGSFDRSIAFAGAAPDAAIVALGPDGDTLSGLTSNGVDILCTIIGPVSQGDPVYLVGYTGTAPTDTDDPNVVFWVSLSDQNAGDWEFELRQPLDHPAPIGDAHFVDLIFSFTATDSDGDAATGTFAVQIDAAGDICACGTTIDYSNLPEGVFINLADGPQTVSGETADANTAQDRDGVTEPVIGRDSLGTDIVDATGTGSRDIIIGGAEANLLRAGGGADTIDGGRGADEIHGEGGADEIYGGRGADLIYGGTGADDIDGGRGDDDIYGEDGADTIYGGRGRDLISGGANADWISGGRGDDWIMGDGGADTIVYYIGDGQDVVEGGAGNDWQEIYGTADSETYNINDILSPFFVPYVGINIRDGISPFEVELADTFNFEVATRDVEDIYIDTGVGDDVVIVSGDLNGTGLATTTIRIEGGSGNGVDIVDARGLTSNHSIEFLGRGGDDLFLVSAAETDDVFRGGGGNDTINFMAVCGCGGGIEVDLEITTPQDTHYGFKTLVDVENVVGSDFDDTISGDASANILLGGSGDDTLRGRDGNDDLQGGDGQDTIFGGGGKDTIFGGAGNDTLAGGAGADDLWGDLDIDQLTGGGGADVFHFAELGAANADTITDYNFAQGDQIDLSSLLDAGFVPGVSDVNDFVRLQASGISDITLQVDTDGAGGPESWADVAVLSNANSAAADAIQLFFGNQTQTLTI